MKASLVLIPRMAFLWAALILLSTAGLTESSVPPKCAPSPTSHWGPWSEWSSCSVSCGGGSRTRTRVCYKYTCTGPVTETGQCNYQPCPPTVCDDDDAVSPVPEWKLGTVDIFTTSTNIMIGTVDIKGHKLGLCWSFTDLTFNQSVTIISPPCNRLRVGAVNGGTPTGQFLGPACTYEVQADDAVDINVQDAAGMCDISQYETAADCPLDVVDITFCSQKTDIGVLLNVEPPNDETSILVGLLGDSNTLAAVNMMRYNATMRAIPGTPWKAVLYRDNDQRVLINGECSYTTTNEPNQIVKVGPVCGGWGDWGPWDTCTFTDGKWRQKRRRPCDSPPPQNDGHCEGDQYEYRTCVCAAPIIPPLATTGNLQPGYNWGDTVEVCCKEGYVSALTGRSSFIICCDYYNRWGNFQQCIRLKCPYPVFPHGVVKGGKPPYYKGSKVTVICNHGYTNIYGKRAFISWCQRTTWWPSRCVVKYCAPLPSIPYGHLYVTPGVTFYRPGDTVKVRCWDGYTLSPNKTLTCDDYGRWTPNLRCIATSCPNTIDLFKYNIGSASLGQPGTPLYNKVFLTCKYGYTARGKDSYRSMCLADGTWSNLQQCQKSDGGIKIVMDGLSIGLLVALLLVVLLTALFCSLLCCCGICCPQRQPVLPHPVRPVIAQPVCIQPVYQPACPEPCPPKVEPAPTCSEKQPSRLWRMMYRLRQIPVTKVTPVVDPACQVY